MNIYKKIRQKNNYSLKKLAKELGIPVELVKVYEKSNIEPSLHYKANFIRKFNVSKEEIKGGI